MKTEVKILLLVLAICFAIPETKGTTVFDDGQTHIIDYQIADTVYVYNNFWNESTTINLVTGGVVTGRLYSYEDSLLNLSGGELQTSFRVYNQSQFYMSSGPLRLLYMYDDSCGIICGGELVRGLISLEQASTLTFYGKDFMIDGHPVYGTITGPGTGTLSGILEDDSLFDDIRFEIQDYASLVFIPEPSTIILLGLGSLMLLKRRKF